jgi:hypothetical protein
LTRKKTKAEHIADWIAGEPERQAAKAAQSQAALIKILRDTENHIRTEQLKQEGN